MPRERKSALKKNNSGAGGDGNENDVPVTKGKKRRTSAANSTGNSSSAANSVQANSNNPPTSNSCGLIPPQPMTGYGDTIFASNPFDDMPPSGHPQTPLTPTQQQPPPPSSGPGSAPPTSNSQMGNMPQNKPMPIMTGKIYPPDQPMVFNPANPNAPPIYPCGTCHKEVHDNDQAILCESGCNFWFHRICTGISETAYHMLTAEVYAEWVCDKCLANKNIPLVKFKP